MEQPTEKHAEKRQKPLCCLFFSYTAVQLHAHHSSTMDTPQCIFRHTAVQFLPIFRGQMKRVKRMIFRNSLHLFFNGFATLFHEPFRSGSGPTDADTLGVVEPATVDVGRSLNEMCVWIDLQTLVIKHATITAFTT